MKKNLIILTKNINKIIAVNQLFPVDLYNLEFVEVLDNYKYNSRFYSINNFVKNIQIDCDQRITSYVARYGGIKDENTFIISIKTGILVDKCHYDNWINFCIVGVMKFNSTRYFVIFPEVEDIRNEYSILYTRHYSGIDIDYDINELKDFINHKYNNTDRLVNKTLIKKNDHIRCLTDDDYIRQIRIALYKIKHVIDE
jgi:hypothetical protein